MADKPWKRDERKICHKFGGERSGPTGIKGADCKYTPGFAIQIKRRKAVAQLYYDALDNVESVAKHCDVPIVVVHKHGTNIDDSIVMLRLSTFIEWYV